MMAFTEEYRKNSFGNSADAKTLARSGFFVDVADKKVKCYVCKGELQHDSECWYSKLHESFSEVHSVRPFETYDHLYLELNRLLTFQDWPITWMSPFDMARSGFYFTRNKDHVACAFCRGIVGDWERNDIADEEHKLHFPECKFMKKEPVGNVPITISQILQKHPIRRRRRVWEQPHINSTETAVHFKTLHKLETRLSSFYKWCPTSNVWPNNGRGLPQPQVLASSGFSYCGLSDHVICYSCGIRLQGWTYDDNVDEIHRTWSPNCPHIVPEQNVEEEEEEEEEEESYIFLDKEIDIMMNELDILKSLGEGTICHMFDDNDDNKESLYRYVRNIFREKLEKTGMLYKTYLEGLDDVYMNIEKYWPIKNTS